MAQNDDLLRKQYHNILSDSRASKADKIRSLLAQGLGVTAAGRLAGSTTSHAQAVKKGQIAPTKAERKSSPQPTLFPKTQKEWLNLFLSHHGTKPTAKQLVALREQYERHPTAYAAIEDYQKACLPPIYEREHWTGFLPDAYAVRDSGHKQVNLLWKINKFEQEIADLKTEYAENERRLETYVLSGRDAWTAEEVAEAKKLASLYGRHENWREYINAQYERNR